jgi:hypothetical protein
MGFRPGLLKFVEVQVASRYNNTLVLGVYSMQRKSCVSGYCYIKYLLIKYEPLQTEMYHIKTVL